MAESLDECRPHLPPKPRFAKVAGLQFCVVQAMGQTGRGVMHAGDGFHTGPFMHFASGIQA